MQSDDQILDGVINRHNAAATTSLYKAADVNPDQEAARVKLAKSTGIPVEALRFRETEAEARRKQNALLPMRDNIKSWVAQDQLNANLAHDDLHKLNMLDRVLNSDAFKTGFDYTLRPIADAMYNLSYSAWGMGRNVADLAASAMEPLNGTVLPENPLANAADFFKRGADAAKATSNEYGIAGGNYEGNIARGVASGLSSLTQNLVTMPLALEMQGVNAARGLFNVTPEISALAPMGATTYGQNYADARAQGLGIGSSMLYGAEQGGIEMATEALPFGKFLESVKAGDPFLKVLGKQLVTENLGEQVATHVQDLVEWLTLHPEKTLKDYLDARPDAALQTLIATTVATAGQTGPLHLVTKVAERQAQKAQEAQQAKAALEQAHTVAQESKLSERSPEAFADAVQHVLAEGPAQAVYVDANTLMQSGLAERVAEVSPSVRAQWATASLIGGQIRIPLDEYVAGVAKDKELAAALIDHVRVGADAMTAKEADEWASSGASTELADDVTKAANTQEAKQAAADSAKVVEDKVFAQLKAANSFTDYYNRLAAKLVAARAQATAQRLGQSPEEWYNARGLRIMSGSLQGGAVMNQNTEDTASTGGELVRLFHGGSATAIEDKGLFRGVFASSDAEAAGSHGGERGTILAMDIPKSDILTNYSLNYEIDYDAVRAAFGNAVKNDSIKGIDPDSDIVWAIVIEDKNANDMDEDEVRAAFGDFDGDFADLVWGAQRIRGQVAKALGYKAVEMDDEHGTSYLVLPGTKIHKVGMSDKHAPLPADTFNQSAYHGSPFRFDKFSLDHMGKGEGAQAYGWGLYFAGSRSVAEWYRETLATGITVSSKSENPLADDVKAEIDKVVDDMGADVDKDVLEEHFNKIGEPGGREENQELSWAYFEMVAAGEINFGTSGQLYQVDIPEDDQYLLWDKPLNEQSQFVKDALMLPESEPLRVVKRGDSWAIENADTGETFAENFANEETAKRLAESSHSEGWMNQSGKQFYNEQSKGFGGDKDASEYLRDAGIAGIKFLDGASRKDGEGSYNYVVFDDNAVKVLETYYQSSNNTPRGMIDLSSNTIALLKGADFSTFVHELGHWFLEDQMRTARDLAQKAELTPGEHSVVNDANTVLKAFGLESFDEYFAMDGATKTKHHESFAEKFERYVFTGNAPSLELQTVFQRFAQLLKRVYQSLKDFIATHPASKGLTDDLRQVMDRMLATDAQIELAQQARSMIPLFTKPEQGMSQEAFSEYQALAADAAATAQQELQTKAVQNLQWYDAAKQREIRRLKRQNKELRAEVEAEVRAEVKAEPVYRAWAYLTRRVAKGQTSDLPMNVDPTTVEEDAVLPAGKLDAQALEEMDTPPEVIADLKKRRMIASDGVHPIVVAEGFGFTSGAELVDALAKALPPKNEIAKRTDQRMLERYGEINTPEALAAEADKAIHNDIAAKMLTTEYNALVAGTGKPKILYRAAKDFAVKTIGNLLVRNVKPAQYTAVEAKAGRAAERAFGAGDRKQAANEKRTQVLNHVLASEAYKALDDIDAGVAYLRRMERGGFSGVPSDYAEQIQVLLSKHDISRKPLKAIDRTKSLETWVRAQLNAGVVPNIGEDLLTPEERKQYRAQVTSRDETGNLVYDDDAQLTLLAQFIDRSKKRSYKDMTVDEFKGLLSSVKQIEHLGRIKNRLLTAKDQKTYQEKRNELAATLKATAKRSGMNTRTDNTLIGKALASVAKFGAEHIKIASLMRAFDGFEDNGPWWNQFVRTANERSDFETTERGKATEALTKILEPVLKKVPKNDLWMKGRKIDSLGLYLNWQERFAIALNYGNESNLQRLMGGGIAAGKDGVKAMSMAQVQDVLRTLTAEEWQAVQAVWDHFETYRPMIAAKETRVNGKEPEWIPARAFAIQTADGQTLNLRGGYFPVVYDKATSLQASQHAAAQDAKDAMKAAYSTATTRRSFTKERVQEVTGRPLLLNLTGLYTGVNDVIHDLAFHEWVLDTNKLLRSTTLDTAIREHYGANAKENIEKWRDHIVAGTHGLDHGAERFFGYARRFISSTAMGFNVLSAIVQPLGITQSIAYLSGKEGPRTGAKWVGKGLEQYLKMGPKQATAYVKSKSQFIDHRTKTMFRDLAELRNKVEGQTSFSELQGKYAFYLTAHMQQFVDIPTWLGAYEKAMSEGHFETNADGTVNDATAVALADQAVKSSQGGGELVDQSWIQRGSPLVKVFTSIYDFMNTQLNVLWLAKEGSKNRSTFIAQYFLVGIATAALTSALRAALVPGDSGDWDDFESIVKTIISESLSNLMGLFVGVRELSQIPNILAGRSKGAGYSGPVGLRLLNDVMDLTTQGGQGELDRSAARAALNVIGDISGFPSTQTNRTITGVEALASGKTSNPLAIPFGYQKP